MSKKAKYLSETNHIIVCCQGSDCCKHGAQDTYKALRCAVREAGLKHEVQCLECECTGLCKFGPIVVISGDGVTWYRKVKAKDAEELVESHIKGGRPLEDKLFSD